MKIANDLYLYLARCPVLSCALQRQRFAFHLAIMTQLRNVGYQASVQEFAGERLLGRGGTCCRAIVTNIAFV